MQLSNRNTRRPLVRLDTLLLSLAACFACGCSNDGSHAEDDHAGEDRHESEDQHEGEDRHEGEDHREGVVELSEAQIEAAGISTHEAGPGQILDTLELPATVVSNADTVLHVTPRVPGLVRAIHKHLGDHVEPGELLCVIDSVELGQAVSDYLRDKELVEAAEETLAQERALFEQRLRTAESVLDGAIAVNQQIFDKERELRDKEVSTIRPLLEAERDLEVSRLQKERDLTDLRAERDVRLLALEVDLRQKRIALRAARNGLLGMGVAGDVVDGLKGESPLVAGTYEIRSPLSGVVTSRHISAGEAVDAQTKLYVVEDLSKVWVIASAYEEQLLSVGTTQEAIIRLDAFPLQTFDGTVSLVGYQVDAESRALGVRVELENPKLSSWTEGYPVRPGMFGTVELVTSRREVPVAVPERALVHEDEGDFVFVQIEPTAFERRAVEVRPGAGELVEILSGIEAGERVAVEGTFYLKSAARSEELGEGHSH